MGPPDDPPTDWVGAPREADVAWVDGARADTRVPPTGPAPPIPPLPDRRRTLRRRRGPALLDVVPIVALALALAGLASLEILSRRSLGRAVGQAEAGLDEASRALALHERRQALQADATRRLLAFRTQQRRAVSMACESGLWCDERLRRIDRSLRLLRPFADGGTLDAGASVTAPLHGLRRERRALEEDLAAIPERAGAEAEQRRAVLLAERAAFESAGIGP